MRNNRVGCQKVAEEEKETMEAKRNIKRKTMAVVAAVLGVCLVATLAFAYYTDTSRAEGSVPFKAPVSTTEVEETVDGLDKQVTVRNEGNVPAAVRVKFVYAASNTDVAVSIPSAEALGNWVAGDDGWFYYTLPLSASGLEGDVTSLLVGAVSFTDKAPADAKVIVLQESTDDFTRTDDGAKVASAVFSEGKVSLSGLRPVEVKGGDE